ncbi:NUDIX hydrolase [Aldersonia sp. NBC_00410]|uniref:NUDIX domain-containing protein n=1 Tax=Aldersonia sp. NBC_00410 TaxID=2975954 RepID=UPI002254A9FD|nr:NUDIX hydrolase [Aldersonia sp. NBC_00410]MCX5044024.1 NUDIX hydrolase [Aldersonia sp. NBC_00410]
MAEAGSVPTPGTHVFDTVSSETLYEGAILALRRDAVVMPDGKPADREVIEHFGAVAIAALGDDGRLVLIRQYRHPVQARLLELPAGLLDAPGEDPLDAAKRELAEETGLVAGVWSVLVDVAVSPGFTDEALRIFLAEQLTEIDRPVAEHEEADLELLRMPLPDAVAATFSGEIVNATAVAGVLAVAAARASGTKLRAPDAPWPGRPAAFAARKARGTVT